MNSLGYPQFSQLRSAFRSLRPPFAGRKEVRRRVIDTCSFCSYMTSLTPSRSRPPNRAPKELGARCSPVLRRVGGKRRVLGQHFDPHSLQNSEKMLAQSLQITRAMLRLTCAFILSIRGLEDECAEPGGLAKSHESYS